MTTSARRSILPAAAGDFLDVLVRLGLVTGDEREQFLTERLDRLRDYTTEERLGMALLHANLLTPYQLERVLTGATHGLVLGNYRIRGELGKGGMGVVYRGEHRLLRRQAAIKVLPIDDDCPAALRQRFFAEMRVLADLSHPNVVLAYDAGEQPGDETGAPLMYLVMELVEGGDLERHVNTHGLCSVAEACSYIRQAAAGLQAAHDQHLIHRDIKPSNLLLTDAGVVKLVDFGLARQFSSRLTDPRALLGSVDFMPPEQSHDPSAVGKQADIYGLGATFFWLLTGEGPYPHEKHVGLALKALQRDQPRRVRDLRPEVPEELDRLIARMLARNPLDRPESAAAVIDSLRDLLRESPLRVRETRVTEELREQNRQLQQSLAARAADLREAHNALLFTVARLSETRHGETTGHLQRMQRYTRVLALEAANLPPWQGLIDERFLEQLERCVPLYDIGKVALPDEVLNKPASLTREERDTVETHPILGDRILEALAREYGQALDFLGMARTIVRSHHERWDGKGYPDRMIGDAIPPAARLVAVADVYDALRRLRLHKPALSHQHTVHVMLERSPGQFDPTLLEAFQRCQGKFETIFNEIEE